MSDIIDDKVLRDLAPTGKVRAAINFGNGVLAQRGPNGEPRGVSVELAARLAERLGVPVDYVTFEAAARRSTRSPAAPSISASSPSTRCGLRRSTSPRLMC